MERGGAAVRGEDRLGARVSGLPIRAGKRTDLVRKMLGGYKKTDIFREKWGPRDGHPYK